MTGTVLPPVAADARQKMSASFANSFRIAAVAERLTAHLQFGVVGNSTEFFNLCLSLARGIDYAVANNEVPPKAHELPSLLKQVCQRKNDLFLQAAIMVLMISVKNACNFGWFTAMDTKELIAFANEIGNSFCSTGDAITALGDSLSLIKIVVARFYPLMKMGHILASLEVKPGYGAYVFDFNISKNTTHSPQEKIRLFVAQRDNTETSACIITPQQVNFLLNGKGVERRTNVLMDTGPQNPTNVTAMLKYGTNLLQAVGQFDGHYLIVVAFMGVMPLTDTPELLDYVQSSVQVADPDSDVIEGPSRVSLNCPISYTRIRTPVKGNSCKHLQCFDFRNYVDINSRRPSWRCPHCNQHVCYTDIRVDQNMVKVLKEVSENVSDVIISADGSWNVLESDSTEQTHKESNNCQKEMPEQQEPSLPVVPLVLDLTKDDDAMDVVSASDIEDRKPFQTQPVASNLTMPTMLNNTIAVDQNVGSQARNDLSSGSHFSHLSGTSSVGLGVQTINGSSQLTSANIMTSPVITDAITTALNCVVESQGNNNFTSLTQNPISTSGASQLQQPQLVNNIEYGRSRQIPANVIRNPVAIQALPASQTPVQAQRPRTNLSTAIPNGSSLTSQAAMSATTANGSNISSNHIDRQQRFPRLHANLHQNLNHRDPSFISGQSAQQVAGFPTKSQLSSALRAQQQAIRIAQARNQSPIVGRPSPALQRSQAQQGAAHVGAGSANTAGYLNRFTAAAQRAVQLARQPPSVPVQIQASRGTSYSNADASRTPPMGQRANLGAAPQVNPGQRANLGAAAQVNPGQRANLGAAPQVNPGSNNVMDSPSEQNWRPTGRMRGSLSGQAAAAYRDLIIQPTQPTQPPQPQRSVTSTPTNVPPNLQAFLASSRNLYPSQAQASSLTQPASTDGSCGNLP